MKKVLHLSIFLLLMAIITIAIGIPKLLSMLWFWGSPPIKPDEEFGESIANVVAHITGYDK